MGLFNCGWGGKSLFYLIYVCRVHGRLRSRHQRPHHRASREEPSMWTTHSAEPAVQPRQRNGSAHVLGRDVPGVQSLNAICLTLQLPHCDQEMKLDVWLESIDRPIGTTSAAFCFIWVSIVRAFGYPPRAAVDVYRREQDPGRSKSSRGWGLVLEPADVQRRDFAEGHAFFHSESNDRPRGPDHGDSRHRIPKRPSHIAGAQQLPQHREISSTEHDSR